MRRLAVAVIVLGATAIASAEVLQAKYGSSQVIGGSPDDVKAVLAAMDDARGSFNQCYAAGKPASASVSFTVGTDGKTSAIKATGLTTKANACLASVVGKLKLAKPKTKLTVTYPIKFEEVVTGGAFASLTGTGDVSSGFDDTNIYGGLLGDEAGEMNGGFGYGRQGFGPGGGGTGWGTIGNGKYGTIGHGSGKVPTTSIGQPDAKGDLDKAIIRRYIKRNIQKITYCYEKQLIQKPKLQGTVTVDFTISVKGSVTSSTGTGVDPDVASCVADVIRGIEFPKPKGGGDVVVKYPFTFRPAEETPPPAPAPPPAKP